MLQELIAELDLLKDSERAQLSQRFFKTGKGEYGEGDIFIGLTVPQIRALAKKYQILSLGDITKLLSSPNHEYRLLALFILIFHYKKADIQGKKNVYDYYLTNTKYINNWDLVDSSAGYIIGEYLLDKSDRSMLYQLVKSPNLWEQRIAIIATMPFLKAKQFEDTIQISLLLLNHPHDLIHKAVGWLLREIGKVDESSLISFLDMYSSKMPRTALRYSIERLTVEKRQYYLKLGR
jgi:3-methyladenine DNA glycosylase AlkD